MTTQEKVFASDAGHWYWPDGRPCYEVPYADKKRKGQMRPTNLGDARKLGLYYSVTGVTQQTPKPFLETWKIKNAVRYAVDHPFIGSGENLEEYVSWVVINAAEEAGKVKDTGQKIHGAIEKWLQSGAVEFNPWVTAASQAITGIDIKSHSHVEKSFAHKALGYGGRIDTAGTLVNFNRRFIIDFKTKNGEFKPPFGFDEHPMQLAAYREGLAAQQKDPSYASARCFNVFISVDQPGEFYVREWLGEELERGWSMFQHLLNFWKAANDYFPGSTPSNNPPSSR